MRGNTTPKPIAASITTAGTPTMTKRSEDPTKARQEETEVGMYTHLIDRSITKRASNTVVAWPRSRDASERHGEGKRAIEIVLRQN